MNLPSFDKQPSLIKATYQINTPMFAAGADQSQAELTPTAFKGVLRFWWRALHWSAIRLQSNNKTEALKQLHRQEAKLFGVATADNRKNQGQGACLVNTLTLSSDKLWQYAGEKTGVNYLLGQGLTSNNNPRYAIDAGQTFTVELTVEPEYHDEVIDVLKIIGLLGGFGSRSRHGLGSVTLIKLEHKAVGENYQPINFNFTNPAQVIEYLLTSYHCLENKELPPLSAFYQGSRIDVINSTNEDSIELLNDLGTEEMLYRSYGKNGKVDGQEAERNFKNDHDLMLNFINKNQETLNNPSHPQRVIFGLPHNYYFSSIEKNIKVDAIAIDKEKYNLRRASPLFRHIHKTEQGYQIVLCLLESEFLPDNARIIINHKKINPNIDWNHIIKFMDKVNKNFAQNNK